MAFFSIYNLANKVMALYEREHVDVSKALHIIANQYDTNVHLIAKELNRRSVALKREEREEEIYRLRQERLRHDAELHEMEMRRGFMLADHMSDY